MIYYIFSVLGNMIAMLIVLWIPTYIYLWVKEKIRQGLHKNGYEVYTEKEKEERNFIPTEEVFETEVVVVTRGGDDIIELPQNDFSSFEDLKELCELSKRKKRKRN